MRSGRTDRDDRLQRTRPRAHSPRRESGYADFTQNGICRNLLTQPSRVEIQSKGSIVVSEHQSAPRRGLSTDRRNHMFQQVFQPAFLPQASMVVNRWSLLDGGKNLDLEIHGCGCGCGGCGDCGGCGCGNCGCGCGGECGCGCGSDSGGSESNTDTFGECVADVATKAVTMATVAAAGTAAVAPALGVATVPAVTLAAVPTALTAAVTEAQNNEACNTDNWSKWYEAPYNGGDSP